ncbi:MAG TPA: sulfate adenylyltransferase [Candidatus Bathyarchaeia archaeon]|nr:sulfate adenylyltransferase [Candidatus Bathyarchaeia archaeon]
MIPAHGGKLINKIVSENKRERILNEYKEMVSLEINDEVVEDVNNISYGVFSPLEGFMGEADVDSIIKNDRMVNDLPWTIPITFDVSKETAEKYKIGDEIALLNGDQEIIGVFQLEEKFPYKKKEIAQSVFQTLDNNHPGVAKVMNSNDTLLAGKIDLVNTIIKEFKEYTKYPAETREMFKQNGWKTVVGFQTRNVPHLGHEYVQKSALTLVDGLFVNPIIGKKKVDDFLDEVILGSYNVLMEHYYRKDKSMMAILRTRMRYGGPKEAIFHAIMRKNFGCSHFIVGRDHAGVGKYYGPFDAHKIFENFPDLEIQPICFSSFFICKKCTGVVNDNICPHEGTDHQINISGSKIRQMIIDKQLDGLNEYMRPEVAQYLIEQKELFVK